MDPSENPDGGKGLYTTTPFGGDDDHQDTHIQPAPPLKSNGGLPGEQEDPRLC